MSPNFYLYIGSRFAAGTALTLARSAIAWHVFALTKSSAYLGLVGLVQFVPALCLTLLGGAVADRFDRRRIINAAQLVFLAAGVILWRAAGSGPTALVSLFVAAAGIAIGSAFEAPSRSALLPTLVVKEAFPRAVAISSTAMALAFATGPALCGLMIAHGGIGRAYLGYLALIAIAFVGIASLKRGPEISARSPVTLRAIAEGLRFVWGQPVVLGCMSLDMFAVIFGGASALLPVYADSILHAGPKGYGILTSSFELGALTMSLLLTLRPPGRSAGRVLFGAVSLFGIATIVFGLSRTLSVSLVAYALAGMADQISVVTRAMAVQLTTPDHLRGRVSAVNMLFIGASNQLGAAESGFVAALTSPTFSVVSGGVACLFVIALLSWRLPALRRYQVA